jgi:hypothetical protein
MKLIKINIKTITEKLVPIYVKSSDLVSVLKEKIEESEGVPINRQRLLFDKQWLEDDKKLSYYNIAAESLIYFVIQQNKKIKI